MVEIMKIAVGMDDLIKMLQERQGDLSPEAFSPVVGIPASSLRSYYTGLRTIGLPNGRKLIARFESMGDTVMAEAIRAYLEKEFAI